MKILVLAAHPDDEILGAGGSMAKWSKQGHQIQIVIAATGLTSRSVSPDQTAKSDLERLQQDAAKATRIVGVDPPTFLDLPDNRMDSMPLLDIVKQLEKIVEDFKPHRVLTQSGGDLNIDHQILFQATMTATRPMRGGSVESVWAYEVNSSTEWAFAQFQPIFRPTHFVDIGIELPQKVEAMEAYTSEKREWPHPRSPKAIEARAHMHGSTVGCEAAEAFHVVWSKES